MHRTDAKTFLSVRRPSAILPSVVPSSFLPLSLLFSQVKHEESGRKGRKERREERREGTADTDDRNDDDDDDSDGDTMVLPD